VLDDDAKFREFKALSGGLVMTISTKKSRVAKISREGRAKQIG